jgi:hypothetical protein
MQFNADSYALLTVGLLHYFSYELLRRSCREGIEYGLETWFCATSISVSRSSAVPSVTGSVPGTID